MQVFYKTYTANITFCRITSCFYGEVDRIKYGNIVFITSCKLDLRNAMQHAVEHYLHWTQELALSQMPAQKQLSYPSQAIEL